jgi:hypothetical protein
MKRISHPGRLAFGLGLAGGLLGSWIGSRRRCQAPDLPDAAAWRKALAETQGEVKAAVWLARARVAFADLKAAAPRFESGALGEHLAGNILPVLALYRTLRASGFEQADALNVLEPVVQAGFKARPAFQLARLTRHLPAPFEALRTFMPIALRRFPPQGWAIEQLENQPDHISFDISRCFYVDVLAAYGAPELCPLFCHADDLLMAEASPQIKWARTGTLAQGAERCDFRWERIERQPEAEVA